MAFIREILLLALGFGYARAVCPDGWDQFHEKCLIASDILLNNEEADLYCANLTSAMENDYIPQLLTIKSRQEQSLFQSWIFNELGLTDGAWLGAKRYDGPIFKWDDQSRLIYNNWRENFPSPSSSNLCVEVAPKTHEMQGDNGNGQWIDVPCDKENIAVCQIPVPVSFQELHMIVNEMKNNPVPAGFIYAQLPGQPSPVVLWPSLIWKNVTDEYAGLFFRVGGADSSQFGEVQEESSASLESVSFISENSTQLPSFIEIPNDGSDSPFILAGFSGQISSEIRNDNEGLSFKFSTKENRPRNTAVFVWKRF